MDDPLGVERLVIVGNGDPAHVGAHLRRAAEAQGFPTAFCDVREAYEAPRWIARANWWLRGRRPSRLRRFSQRVLETCRAFRPTRVICTGIAPVDRSTLHALGTLGIDRVCYLTDDPWNPAHRPRWFLGTLSAYDRVFSTRRAALDDLRRAGCTRSAYLPFGFAPDVHFPDPPRTPEDRARFAADVVFAGGADADRVPYVAALVRAGFHVALYGAYWESYLETRSHTRGHADWTTLRKALGGAKVALCLVRRANRDGHVMRTFEVAATGACMLTEDTEEHRELLGKDGDTTVYFRSAAEMIDKLRWLLADDGLRARLASALHRRVVDGRNTYGDRLRAMLEPVTVSTVNPEATPTSRSTVSPSPRIWRARSWRGGTTSTCLRAVLGERRFDSAISPRASGAS
jgi:spore maturation protein CgeB